LGQPEARPDRGRHESGPTSGTKSARPARSAYYFQYINYNLYPLTLKIFPSSFPPPSRRHYLASAPPGPVISPPATRSNTATLPPPPLSAAPVPLPPAPPPPPRLPLSSGARRGPTVKVVHSSSPRRIRGGSAAEVALPATDSRRPVGRGCAPMADLLQLGSGGSSPYGGARRSPAAEVALPNSPRWIHSSAAKACHRAWHDTSPTAGAIVLRHDTARKNGHRVVLGPPLRHEARHGTALFRRRA
jgi:hypothetical protein